MRVLHVVATGGRRGAEIFASDLVAWLDGEGVSQVVAVLRGREDPAVAYVAPVRLLGSTDPTFPGVRVSLGTLRGLRKLITRWHPSVLQAHGGEAFKYSMLATPTRRPPVVYRRIGSAPRWIRTGPRRSVHGFLMRRAASVVAVAEAVRRETMELFGVRQGRIVTIPNGVDARRLEQVKGRAATRDALGIGPMASVVLSLGALTWEKDPLAHVEIAARVLSEQPQAVHLFVGDGPMRAEVERAIRQRGLEARVLMLGARSDVGDLLAAGDVFLFASRGDGMEGMPASLIEAGMAGLPVVAYSVAGVPEVVIDGTTGLLAREGDIETVAAHALSLLADIDRRRSMGEKASEHCRSLFGIEAIAPKYLDVYRNLVEAP